MNPEVVLKFMSQVRPWSFGLRAAVPGANRDTVESEPGINEYPFYASTGDQESGLYTVIGNNLEECMKVAMSPLPGLNCERVTK